MVSPKSADHANWANSSTRGWRRSGGLTWNSLIPVGHTWRARVLLPSMTTSIIRPAFRTLVIFHGPIPLSCSSLPPLPFRSTLLLGSFAKTRFPVGATVPADSLLFCCLLWSGVGLTLMALYRDRSYFSEILPSGLHKVVWSSRSVCRVYLWHESVYLGVCGLSNLTNRGHSGGTSLRVHLGYFLRHERGQGNIHFSCLADHVQDWQSYPVDPYSYYMCDHTYLLASGPALALVLHLPMKCGSRTPGLEFCCRIVSREEGYCVSWVPLGIERVACMTAAYLETSSRKLSNEDVLVVALTLCQFGICDDIPLLSPRL